MIAALPMYDFGDLPPVNDRFWALIRDNLQQSGIDAPATLHRSSAPLMDIWRAPDLLLAQTCGYPYRSHLHGQVSLVGTPDYGLQDCASGEYFSVLVARANDPRDRLEAFHDAQLAYNEALSQSGWAAPQNHAAKLGLSLRAGPQTGAHRDSAIAVLQGSADLAAIDAVTWRHLQRNFPEMAGLKQIGRTSPTPGLPLITAKTRDPAPLSDAVARAIDRLTTADRKTLGIRGLVTLHTESYLAVPSPPDPAQIAQAH